MIQEYISKLSFSFSYLSFHGARYRLLNGVGFSIFPLALPGK